MRYAVIGIGILLSLAVVLLYAACVVGGKADRREEAWFDDKRRGN